MTFEKNEKVLIHNNSRLKGRLGRVVLAAGDRIKVEIPGHQYMWFQPQMLRKVRFTAPFEKIEPGAPVKVVDVKGSYEQRNIIGTCGHVNWTLKNQVLVESGKELSYLELGDVQVLPDQKWAYVCLPSHIERLLLKLSNIYKGRAIWKDGANYLYADNIVHDSITSALDYQRHKSKNQTFEVRL